MTLKYAQTGGHELSVGKFYSRGTQQAMPKPKVK